MLSSSKDEQGLELLASFCTFGSLANTHTLRQLPREAGSQQLCPQYKTSCCVFFSFLFFFSFTITDDAHIPTTQRTNTAHRTRTPTNASPMQHATIILSNCCYTSNGWINCAIFSCISTPFAMIQVSANYYSFIPKESETQKTFPSGKKKVRGGQNSRKVEKKSKKKWGMLCLWEADP